jgi:hypothetical protein
VPPRQETDIHVGGYPAACEKKEPHAARVSLRVNGKAVDFKVTQDVVGIPKVKAEDAEKAARRIGGVEYQAPSHARGTRDLKCLFFGERRGAARCGSFADEVKVEVRDDLVGAANLPRFTKPPNVRAMDFVAIRP